VLIANFIFELHLLWFGVRSHSKESKFKPLPEEEKRIGERLAAMRRFKGISQEQLSNIVRCSRNQIANIEASRVSLKAVMGLRICKALNINPNWLFRGDGPQSPMTEIESEDVLYWSALALVSDRVLFSSFWTPFTGGKVTALKTDTLVKHYLTNENETAKLRSVNINSIGQLSLLLRRARKLILARGAKSKLAAHLGVSRQAVSEWFSGKSNPGAETTLKLLKWVEQQERKN